MVTTSFSISSIAYYGVPQGSVCITPALKKSIAVKNKFLSDFIKKKDPTIKAELYLQYKNDRNYLYLKLPR